MEIKNIELRIYSLKNNETGFYDVLRLGIDDKSAVDGYLDDFRKLFVDMDHDDNLKSQKDIFLSRFEKSSIYRLGSINQETGELINDPLLLCKLERKLLVIDKKKESD